VAAPSQVRNLWLAFGAAGATLVVVAAVLAGPAIMACYGDPAGLLIRHHGETATLAERPGNRLAFGYTNSDTLNYDPAQAVTPLTFDSTGRNKRWEYQGSLEITPAWTATFGAEREQASFRTRSPSAFAPAPAAATAKVGIDSLYAQVRGDLGDHLSVSVGLRRDSHDTFGDHTLGQVAAAWTVAPGTVVRASFGQGFKAPTLYQLYSEYGNLGLAAEQADAWDLGVEHTVGDGWLMVAATGFGRETENRIDYVSCADGTTLAELARVEGPALLSLAVRFGTTRLIDNEPLVTAGADR